MDRNEARRIDEQLAVIWQRAANARQSIANARQMKARYPRDARTAARCDEMVAAAEVKLAEANAEAAPFEAIYREHGWSRFFLVDASNGHVHSSMSCSTCFPTTVYGWLPELSGASEDEAVEEFGEKMCSICFPSAPTDPRCSRPGRRDRAATEARDAEKAAKAAAKAAKAAASALRELNRLAVDGRLDARLVALGRYADNEFTRGEIAKGKAAEATLWAEHGVDPAEIEKKAAAKWRREYAATFGSWPR